MLRTREEMSRDEGICFVSRSYTFAAGGMPGELSGSIADTIGAGCDPDYSLASWTCPHRPHCPPTSNIVVAAELRRRGWPARRVRAWLAHQRGAWLGKEDTDIRRALNRQYRRRAASAVRNAEYDDATDAAERPRRTSGWMTW